MAARTGTDERLDAAPEPTSMAARADEEPTNVSWLADTLGVAWVLIAAVVVLVPAFVHGVSFGPFDLLPHQAGLSRQPAVPAHNFAFVDQIDAIIPWQTLAWKQVHHGHLPLWNPDSALGMPLAFNWQSAPFSLPVVIGYLVPLRFAYTLGMLVTLVVAGTGAYVLGRVLGLGVLGCVVAGTVFELSGPMAGWLGYPHGSVMSWAGWLFAAALLLTRGRRRLRDITFFAIVLALAVYAGQPEIVLLLGATLAVFLAIVLGARAVSPAHSGPILRPVIDLAIATLAGIALAAPLALPGLELAATSVRHGAASGSALPSQDLMYLISNGFNGLPLAGNLTFGDSYYFNETAAYVGVIALVLAATAIAFRRRRPEVIAFAAIAGAAATILFVPVAMSFMSALPGVGTIAWRRLLLILTFALAVLAGVGIDVLVRSSRERAVRRWVGGGFAVAALIVLVVFLTSRHTLTPFEAHIRARSFIWPAVDSAVGLIVIAVLFAVTRARDTDHPRAGRRVGGAALAGIALLVCETGFLIAVGAPLRSSSSHFFSPTPAEATLRRAVGSATVGFGAGECGDVGILPNVNVVYGVHELDAYDPILPSRYWNAWRRFTATQPGLVNWNLYCPRITTAAQARRYGVGYVLEPPGAPGPEGGVFVVLVGNEKLYRIPGSGEAILVPAATSKTPVDADAVGTALPVSHPDPATWKLETASTGSSVLRLRLTNVPGWQATLDGRPLRLTRFSSVMLQARIPPGRHRVVIRYWPKTFTLGIVVAACSVLGLTAALVVDAARRRRAST